MSHQDHETEDVPPHEQVTGHVTRLEVARRIAREILRADRQNIEVEARLLRG